VVIENRELRVETDRKTLTFTVIDKVSGERWAHPREPVSIRGGDGNRANRGGRATIRHRKDGIEIEIKKIRCDGDPPMELSIRYDMVLEKNCLKLTLHPIEGLKKGEILDLGFPRDFGFAQPFAGPTGASSADKGYMVLPHYDGILYPFGNTRAATLHTLPACGAGPLALFGMVKNNSAMAAVVKTRFDYSLDIAVTGTPGAYCGITPVWRIEESRLNYPRRIHYHFIPRGTYVDIAKAYRKEKREEGGFVTLKEKAARYPTVAGLVGAVAGQRRGPEFNDGTFDGAMNFFNTAKEKGFDRAILFSGFPLPWKGAKTDRKMLARLKKAAREIRSLSPGYHLSYYTQYMDLHVKKGAPVPPVVMRNRDGSPARCWYDSYAVCGRFRLENAKKDLPRRKHATGAGCIYVDIEGCGARECFHPDHPATAAQDTEYRRQILQYTKEVFGAVATESLPWDAVSDIVDIGAYFNFYPYNIRNPKMLGEDKPVELHGAIGIPVIPIPLYQLIYHDSVMNVSSGGWIEDWFDTYPIEPLHLPLFGMMPDDFSERSYRMSHQMRETQYAEMLTHEFLTGPKISIDPEGLYHTHDVQKSTFADGTVVVANFSQELFPYEKQSIKPRDFIIVKDG